MCLYVAPDITYIIDRFLVDEPRIILIILKWYDDVLRYGLFFIDKKN